MTSCYVQFLSYSTQRSGMETGGSRCFPLRMKGNACEIPRVVVRLKTRACTCLASCVYVEMTAAGKNMVLHGE